MGAMALAGITGATAFTPLRILLLFTTGTTARCWIVGDDVREFVTASLLILFFAAGVVIASKRLAAFGGASPRPDRATTFSLIFT